MTSTPCCPEQGSILKNGAEWRESARARAFGTPERGSLMQQRYGGGDRNDPRGQSLTNEANPSQFLLRQQPPIKADLNYGKPQQPHTVLPAHDMAGETTASGDSYELTPLSSQQQHHNNAMSSTRSDHLRIFFSCLHHGKKILCYFPDSKLSNEIFWYFLFSNTNRYNVHISNRYQMSHFACLIVNLQHFVKVG